MEHAGDALATALAAVLGPDHALIRMWDEAKRENPDAFREEQKNAS